ncbi:hypothetical protein ILUMI_02089 [Ignelater luminosus]|uniref:Uncharacterized protein n=1 Tax=Ignelater luminosus TaxID=2038154 RepID=A0A8K0DIT7_IGNLU|nr:hypothetical protein ILUMI_02089 [Ignelater luminosus]
MIISVSFLILLMQVKLVYLDIEDQDDYGKNSELGVLARLDLINALKIALKDANPKPSKEERLAAGTFVKFLSRSVSNEYLEAFYSTHTYQKVNQFVSFLNAIRFNGNPDSKVWYAAEILVNMIKTKTSENDIEQKRQRMKRVEKVARTTKIFHHSPRQPVDIVKMYQESDEPYNLKELIDRVAQIYNTRKNTNLKKFGRLLTLILDSIFKKFHQKLEKKICKTEDVDKSLWKRNDCLRRHRYLKA